MPFFARRLSHRPRIAWKALLALCVIGLTGALAGCGASSNSLSVDTSVPQLTSVVVDPPDPSVALGLTTQLSATGIYDDGTQKDLSQQVQWTSATPAVATISDHAVVNGVVTAVSQGTSVVTATLAGLSGTATVTVTPPALQFIAVTPIKSTIGITGHQQFMATGVYSDRSTQDLTGSVAWHSAAPGVATITTTGGLATAVGPGITTISAGLGTLTGSTTLTVGTAPTLASITVTPMNPRIPNGLTQQFTATGTYSDGSTQPLTTAVTWVSGTPAVASIGATGLATALTQGTTSITATLGAVTGATALTVIAPNLVSIAVTPATASITTRGRQVFVATGTYSDRTTQIISTLVTWTSSAPAVATVSNAAGSQGVATAVAVGTTTISAALGTVPPGTATLTVTLAPKYAYVADYGTAFGANSFVSQYSIGANGALTPLMPPTVPLTPPTVPTGTGGFSIAVDPTGSYVYVANYDGAGPGTVTQFSKAADGTLHPMVPATVATGDGPNGITVDPVAPYAYVAEFDGNALQQFTLGATGGLTLTSTVAAAAGAAPASITVDPTGQHAYVANFNNGTVGQYAVNPATGALTAIGSGAVVAGMNPNSVVIDSTGQFAYAANYANGGPGTVSQYIVNPADGSLDPLTPATVATGLGPFAVTLDNTGKYAYVANSGDNTISQYAVVAGMLMPLNPATIAAGTHPSYVAIDPTNQFAYAANRVSNDVTEFSIDPATGLLTLVGTVSVAPAAGPTAIATSY